MKRSRPTLQPLFRSEALGRLLAEVLIEPDQERSVSELARRVGTSPATATRELARAEEAGLVRSRRSGPTKLVRGARDHPLFDPVTRIVLTTFGPPAVLAEELATIDGVAAAYVFGSWAARASGEPGRAPNDIDVLALGRPDRDAIYDAAERAEARLGRPVQITIRSVEDWEADRDPFLREVRKRPLVPIPVGDR